MAGLVLSGASATYGGSPEAMWWRSPSVQSTISLTADQVARLEAIHRDTLPARRRLRDRLTELQRRLDRVLAEGRYDGEHGRLLIGQVFEAEKQRNIARTLMLLRMYRVLTPDQRVKLASRIR